MLEQDAILGSAKPQRVFANLKPLRQLSVPSGSFQVGVSENREHPIVPNGFHDHYPVFKWLFHWEYTLFSDKPK